jgi:thiamine-phosphate pyrophosphorylase
MSQLLLYYITDRTQFSGDEPTRRRQLLAKIREAAQASIDYIQLREKDPPARELESLAAEAMGILCELRNQNRELTTKLLINSRTDIALAVGADGVHLRSDDVSPVEVRRIWQCSAGAPARVTVTVSCHKAEEVRQAASDGADLALFAPVFEKKDRPGTHPAGLEDLRRACQFEIPVLALGGITLENAAVCVAAGAAGIAAIRHFQENDIREVARRLRALKALRLPS